MITSIIFITNILYKGGKIAVAKVNIDQANQDLVELYKDFKPIVDQIVDKHTKELDKIISKIKNSLDDNLSHQELYSYMMQLSVETYYMSHSKDMALLRQDCAETLMKAKQAEVFNETVGTQVVRNNQAIMDTIDKQVINLIHRAVANCLRTKLDEAHRMCNTLANVLISKNAENKFKAGAGEPVSEVTKNDSDIYDNDVGEDGDNPFP